MLLSVQHLALLQWRLSNAQQYELAFFFRIQLLEVMGLEDIKSSFKEALAKPLHVISMFHGSQ